MRLRVIMNAAAGSSAGEARAIAAALQTNVEQATGADLARLVSQTAASSDCDAVVACGGDGTISLAAQECVRTGKLLGVIPAGTLNHFAQDLGIPEAPEEAACVIAAGKIAQVDVGEVNGRVFINNVSFGVYPAVVRERERRQRHSGWSKWAALMAASFEVLRQMPRHRLRLVIDQQSLERRTPFLFIGNNRYELGWPGVGSRRRLNGGELSVLVAHTRTRWGLLALALQALVGRLVSAEAFDSFVAQSVWVRSRRRELTAGLDGELVRLTPPLEVRIRSAALRVLVP